MFFTNWRHNLSHWQSKIIENHSEQWFNENRDNKHNNISHIICHASLDGKRQFGICVFFRLCQFLFLFLTVLWLIKKHIYSRIFIYVLYGIFLNVVNLKLNNFLSVALFRIINDLLSMIWDYNRNFEFPFTWTLSFKQRKNRKK